MMSAPPQRVLTRILISLLLVLLPWGVLGAQAKVARSDGRFHVFVQGVKPSDSWQMYLSFGIGTGHPESHLGVADANLRLEAGRVFRYDASFAQDWVEEDPLVPLAVGDGWLVNLPLTHLARESSIRWRWVGFGESKKVFPTDGPGVVAATLPFDLQPSESRPASTALLLAAPKGSGGFGFTELQQTIPNPPVDPSVLSAPWPSTLWTSTRAESSLTAWSSLLDLDPWSTFQRPLLGDRPKALDAAQSIVNHRVRLWTAALVGQPALLTLRSAQECPLQAQHVLIDFPREVDERVLELDALRKARPDLHIYGIWPDQLDGLTREAWIKYGVDPLMPSDRTLGDLDHNELVNWTWFRLLVQEVKELSSRRAWMSPPPLGGQADWEARQRLAPEVHQEQLLVHLRAMLQRRMSSEP